MAAFFQHLKNGFYAAREYNTLKLIPLRQTLAGYQVGYLSGDLRAGLNVALLAFPQGMAYALIAGLPIQYGIYGSAIAAMVAPIFAKSHFITVGPTNATSVMLLSAFASLGIVGAEKLGMAPLLILMVGLFVVIGAYFKVANLVQYISRSVITGYITAAALLIITNQIPKSLGLEMLAKGATFYESVVLMFQSIHTAHWATLGVSLSTACLFIFLNKKFKALPNVAICLVAISAATELIFGHESGIKFLSGINAADWSFQAPDFSLNSIQLARQPRARDRSALYPRRNLHRQIAGSQNRRPSRCQPSDVLDRYGQHCLRFFLRDARFRLVDSFDPQHHERWTHRSGELHQWRHCLHRCLCFRAAHTIHPTMCTCCPCHRNRHFAY